MKEELIEKIKDYVNGYVLNLNKEEINYLLHALSQSDDINIKDLQRYENNEHGMVESVKGNYLSYDDYKKIIK